MTIRLLAAYGKYPCNAIVTLDSATEAGLVAAKQALVDLTGGSAYVAPVPQKQSFPVMAEVDLTGGIEFSAAGMLIPSALPQTSWMTKIPTIANAGLNSGSLGYTHQSMIELEAPFDAVRIPFFNYDTAYTNVVESCNVSVGSDASDALNNSATAVTMTFGGAVSVTIPVATTINTRVYPGVVWSDPIYIDSVARTDGGVLPLLYVRCFTATGANRSWSTWTNGATSWGAAGSTRKWVTRYKSGDFCSTARTSFTDVTNRSFSVVFGVAYRARRRLAVSVAFFGDSITRTSNAEGAARGFHYKTQQAISTPDHPFEYANYGVSSSTFDEFLYTASVFLPLTKPMFATFPAFSPNDGPAGIANCKTNMLKMIDLCRANDVIPVIWEGCPRSVSEGVSAYSLADDLLRTNWVSQAGNYAPRVIKTLASMSTAAAPYAYKAGYSTDWLHPNFAGDDALSVPFSGFFRPIVAVL